MLYIEYTCTSIDYTHSNYIWCGVYSKTGSISLFVSGHMLAGSCRVYSKVGTNQSNIAII